MPLLRGGLESMLPLQRSLDLDRRYGGVLLCDAMRDDHHRSAAENRNLKDMDYLPDYDERGWNSQFSLEVLTAACGDLPATKSM
jgi:hypothetical protein